MIYLLLKYDPEADEADVTPFESVDDAVAELKRATLAKRSDDEVVLFYSDSLETLKKTHSRYFYSVQALASAAELGARIDGEFEQALASAAELMTQMSNEPKRALASAAELMTRMDNEFKSAAELMTQMSNEPKRALASAAELMTRMDNEFKRVFAQVA